MAGTLFSCGYVFRYAAFFIVLINLSCAARLKEEYGVLQASSSTNATNDQRFCIWYLPEIFGPLKQNNEIQNVFPVQDLSDLSTCSNYSFTKNIKNQYVIIRQRAECSLQEQVETIKNNHGAAVLVRLVETNGPSIDQNRTKVLMPVVFISNSTYYKLKALEPNLQAGAFGSADKAFNLSLIVIWLMAVLTICVGSYWSGRVRYKLHRPYFERNQQGETIDDSAKEGPRYEDPSMTLTPVTVLLLVLCMCGMLLLLFYFFDYLVYVVMAMYCYASATALFTCGNSILATWNCFSLRLFSVDNKCYVGDFKLRHLLLLVVCITIPALWVVFRMESWSWMLQDFLGIFFSIHILRMIRLPSLKICTILLTLLFVYDIFFVFITPFFTSSGESVMVEVATGGQGRGGTEPKEQLPLVLKVPYILYGNDQVGELCYGNRYSLLGFGDILVPGLLVSLCYSYDQLLNTPGRHLYLIAEITSYGLGLIVTFFALALMDSAQPALLYLVPFTLIPAIAISLWRKEFSHLWYGTIPAEAISAAIAEAIASDRHDNANPRYNGTNNPAVEDNRTLIESG